MHMQTRLTVLYLLHVACKGQHKQGAVLPVACKGQHTMAVAGETASSSHGVAVVIGYAFYLFVIGAVRSEWPSITVVFFILVVPNPRTLVEYTPHQDWSANLIVVG